MSSPVDVVRDVYGVPHIYAANVDDLAFVNGYILAHDRLPQMNLFRHAAEGRVSELFGALDPGQIDSDIEMRLHRLHPLAQDTWDEMTASTDPDDQAIVRYFTRFADGVNAYAADLAAGKYQLDPAVSVFFPVDKWEDWTPVDSLAIGRLQTYALSYDEFDLRITRSLERADQVFAQSADPDYQRRAKAAYDIIQIRPDRNASPLDGFPNVGTDTGTRAKPGAPPIVTTRPVVPLDVLDAAIYAGKPKTLAGLDLSGPMMASNNWIVGPKLAGDGTTILSNDTHLPLTSPSIWWMVHLTSADPKSPLDVEGVSFPGLPMVQLGHNEHLAWGATVVFHDVYDFYAENIVPCDGGGDCVSFKGDKVPVKTFSEEIKIGANSTITGSKTVTFEYVDHHGPFIPTIANHDVVPRTGQAAISVKYTGHQVTHEVRAVYRMLSATTVAEGMNALDDWNHGAMNWILADDQGHIAYTASALIPRRTPGCFTFNRETNPGGVAPFFVLPGDGSCEWNGFMSDRYMPHAIDPAKGYLATANADPVGGTFDNDALNGPIVDSDGPLYLGALYDPGFRVGRIYDRLDAFAAAGTPVTHDDMASIQADDHSNFGERMRPFIVAAVAGAQDGSKPDAKAYFDALPQARKDRLLDAVARLKAWTLATPPAIEGTPSDAEIADSSATTIFNAWAVYFFADTYGDELAAIDESFEMNLIARLGLTLFEHPDQLLTGIDPSTNEPVLCDDLNTPGTIESCSFIVVRALDKALDWAEGEYGSTDPTMWRWGEVHRLTLESQLPDTELDVPPASEPKPEWQGGYPRHGDTYAVDASSGDYNDFDFTYDLGPAMRHITVFAPGERPVTYFALPGGEEDNRSSPHYRDIIDNYYIKNQYLVFPWKAETVVEQAEGRTRFQPKK
jgi:penicillin amidase